MRPRLAVLDAKGSIVTEADDTRGLGKDARIEWKAPADGAYVIQVSDLHDRGGLSFGYVLLAEAANPDFTLTCDPDMVNVGPAGRVPVFVRLTRRGRLRWRGQSGLARAAGGRDGESTHDRSSDDRRRDRRLGR